MAALARLKQERKSIRQDRPHGFSAKPSKDADGAMDMYKWKCVIPGRDGTPWEGGYYHLTVMFTDDYPLVPPKAKFLPGMFHPNVYPNGDVCLTLLKPREQNGDWSPQVTLLTVLKSIQNLLETPNNGDAAQEDAYQAFMKGKEHYEQRIRDQAKRMNTP